LSPISLHPARSPIHRKAVSKLRHGLDPLDRNIKLFFKDNSFLGNNFLDFSPRIMNDIGNLRFADIVLSQMPTAILFASSLAH
jgi:hypothetical protein